MGSGACPRKQFGDEGAGRRCGPELLDLDGGAAGEALKALAVCCRQIPRTWPQCQTRGSLLAAKDCGNLSFPPAGTSSAACGRKSVNTRS